MRWWIVLALVLGLALVFCRGGGERVEVVRDTVVVREPVLVERKVVEERVVVAKRVASPGAPPQPSPQGEGALPGYSDSVAVVLPVVQERYEGDGYVAWVSGVEVRLDSIAIEREVVTVSEPQKRWHIGPCVGVGYGVGGAGVFVGVSISYSFFSF